MIPSKTSWSIARRATAILRQRAGALAPLDRHPGPVVNGFKGGDWNELTQTLNVRQKHAHSWVEAYLGPDRKGTPDLVTLDPTPAGERNESVAQVGGLAGSFRLFTDLIRYIWVFYIVGYNADRQELPVYAPDADHHP